MAVQWLLKKHVQETKINFLRHKENFCYRKIAGVFLCFKLNSKLYPADYPNSILIGKIESD
jgi:hypothetical protein